MSSYVTLVGSEDVSRAGSNMRDAASTMQQAASSISWSLEQNQRFMDDWLARLAEVLNKENSNGV